MLQIEYKNGEKRNIQVHSSFFENTLVKENNGKNVVLSPQQKSIDLADILGQYPFKIVLSKGSDIMYEKINAGNNPKEFAIEGKQPDEKQVKKDLRKEHKRTAFKYIWKLGENAPLQQVA